MEGKEARFGIANSALFATVTTDASCGAVNAMHELVHAAWRTLVARQHHARRGDSSGALAPALNRYPDSSSPRSPLQG